MTLTRRLSGRPISQGGRDHTSHRLVVLGLSERRAVLVLYGLSLTSGATAMVVNRFSYSAGLAILPLLLIALTLVGVYLAQVEVSTGPSARHNHEIAREALPLKGSSFTLRVGTLTYKRRVFEVLLDLVLVALSYYLAYLLRFEQGLAGENVRLFLQSLPLVVAAKIVCLWAFGIYQGVWHQMGLRDLRRCVKGVAGGEALSVLLLGLYRFHHYSRTLFIIDGLVLFLLVSGSRLSFRFLDNLAREQRQQRGRPVLIYGAGRGGELLLWEIQSNEALGLRPVGFLDDDEHKQGRLIHGCPVLGGREEIEEILERKEIEEVLLSTPLKEDALERVRAACRSRKIRLRVMRLRLEEGFTAGPTNEGVSRSA